MAGHLMRQLMMGQLKSSQLPSSFDPWDLKDGINQLRKNSFTDNAEWGGCMVLEGEHLALTHEVQGSSTGVNPDCKPEEHDSYVGFAHIHLPDDATGKPYPGFSELDFAATLTDGDNMALVCNGAEVFALVRTKDHTAPRRDVSESELSVWGSIYEMFLNQAQSKMTQDSAVRAKGSDLLSRALWHANRTLCQRLGYALYYGRWAEPLQRVFQPL